MTKEEFLTALRSALMEERINNVESLVEYYDEMISDRIEDGMSEEEAVEAMGPIADIVSEVSWDRPIGTLVKEKVVKSHESAKGNGKNMLWVALMIVGFPLWFPVAITIFILLGVIYMIPWIFIFTFFVILASFAFAAVACLIGFVVEITKLSLASACISLGIALILASICMVIVRPVIWLTKATLHVGTKAFGFIKRLIF